MINQLNEFLSDLYRLRSLCDEGIDSFDVRGIDSIDMELSSIIEKYQDRVDHYELSEQGLLQDVLDICEEGSKTQMTSGGVAEAVRFKYGVK